MSSAAYAVIAIQRKDCAVPGRHEECDWLTLELCVSLACSLACAAEQRHSYGLHQAHCICEACSSGVCDTKECMLILGKQCAFAALHALQNRAVKTGLVDESACSRSMTWCQDLTLGTLGVRLARAGLLLPLDLEQCGWIYPGEIHAFPFLGRCVRCQWRTCRHSHRPSARCVSLLRATLYHPRHSTVSARGLASDCQLGLCLYLKSYGSI